jgi:hypothetical protein
MDISFDGANRMTDWQLEKLAGEAIGMDLAGVEGKADFLWDRSTCEIWVPLQIGEQALQLVEKLHLHVDQRPGLQISVQPPDFSEMVCYEARKGHRLDLRRAIVECAAIIRRRAIAGDSAR